MLRLSVRDRLRVGDRHPRTQAVKTYGDVEGGGVADVVAVRFERRAEHGDVLLEHRSAEPVDHKLHRAVISRNFGQSRGVWLWLASHGRHTYFRMMATTQGEDMPSGAAVAEPGAKKTTFRPDVQGLRMIAVVAVISDHLFHWPAGGFVGVDIFFVISGFLITSLLLREHEKTGTISFWGFYRRRIKRIIPAAMIVIVATIIAAWLLFSTARFGQTFWDGVWATVFMANWHFAIVGTDYFSADAAVSPLQHYWSLSVEEQFYFVWPWLMLLIFSIVAISKGTVRHARGIVLAVISVTTVASFIWAMWETATLPTVAYFSTFSRAWELGIGALLAVIAPVFTALPQWARPIAAWLGMAGIAISLFTVTADSGFPAPWATLPVLATALVIVSGTGGVARFIWPITNPVSSYIGDISYSLYLWHWPIIVFLALFFAEGDVWFYIVAIIAIASLSTVSYHGIENPIRLSSWLDPKPKKRPRPGTAGAAPMYIAVGLLAVIVVGLSGAALAPRAVPSSQSAGHTPEPTSGSSSEDGASAEVGRQDQILASLAETDWPSNITPSLDLPAADLYVPEWLTDRCLNVGPDNVERCAYGDPSADHVVAVLGDSTAISEMPMLREVFSTSRIQSLTREQCPASAVTVTLISGDPYPACDQHRAWVMDWVATNHPDLVLVTESSTSSDRVAPDSANTYEAGLALTLAELGSESGQVVYVMPPPVGANLGECKTPFSTPSDCVSKVGGSYTSWQSTVSAVAAEQGVPFMPVLSWFCEYGRCPAFIESTRTFAGGEHLTADASRAAAPLFSEALAGLIG